MQRATTTVAILRGTTENAYGDDVDNATVAASGVVASIRERNRLATPPVDGRPQQVTFYVGRVPDGTDVTISDRVKDETTGNVYTVASIGSAASSVRTNDLRLELRRVS